MSNSTMFVIIAQTNSFEFIGLGRDLEEANNALLKCWAKWCKSVPDADPYYMLELIDEGSTQVVQLEPGAAVIYGVDG